MTSPSSEPGPPTSQHPQPRRGGSLPTHVCTLSSHMFNSLSFRGQSSLSNVPDALRQLHPYPQVPPTRPAPGPLTPVSSPLSHALCLLLEAVCWGGGVQSPLALQDTRPGHKRRPGEDGRRNKGRKKERGRREGGTYRVWQLKHSHTQRSCTGSGREAGGRGGQPRNTGPAPWELQQGPPASQPWGFCPSSRLSGAVRQTGQLGWL